MSVNARLVTEGLAFNIFEIVRNGRSYVEEFIYELPEDTRARLNRLIEYISDQGAPRNQQKFRHEADGIYAIKQAQARLYCFFGAGRVILLTHGTVKKRQKAHPEDLARAKRLRESYLKAQRS